MEKILKSLLLNVVIYQNQIKKVNLCLLINFCCTVACPNIGILEKMLVMRQDYNNLHNFIRIIVCQGHILKKEVVQEEINKSCNLINKYFIFLKILLFAFCFHELFLINIFFKLALLYFHDFIEKMIYIMHMEFNHTLFRFRMR